MEARHTIQAYQKRFAGQVCEHDAGYSALREREIIEAACTAHARRYFVDPKDNAVVYVYQVKCD